MLATAAFFKMDFKKTCLCMLLSVGLLHYPHSPVQFVFLSIKITLLIKICEWIFNNRR